jgi:hypothetical protein
MPAGYQNQNDQVKVVLAGMTIAAFVNKQRGRSPLTLAQFAF